MSISILPNEIHLWFVYSEQIQDADLLACYSQLISKSETVKNSRFVFEKDRKQNLITRALIRTVLSKYVDHIAPTDWEFTHNEYGKPEVLSAMLPFPIKFNLSHTQNMIALAVTHGEEVGIDVESLKRDIATDDLAKHVFSEQEYFQLEQLDAHYFHQRFFDLWTLKEAYIKACGMGLSIPLDSFSFYFSEINGAPSTVSIRFQKQTQDEPDLWKFWQIKTFDDFVVSLALKSKRAKNSYVISMHQIVPLLNSSPINLPSFLESE